jgi:hypothetical protein
MGRFQAISTPACPVDRRIEEVAQQLQEVLARHDVMVVGFETAEPEGCAVTVVVWVLRPDCGGAAQYVVFACEAS